MKVEGSLLGNRIDGGFKPPRLNFSLGGLTKNTSNAQVSPKQAVDTMIPQPSRRLSPVPAQGPQLVASPPVVRSPKRRRSLDGSFEEWYEERVWDWKGFEVDKQCAPKAAPPVVILPGFANNKRDYLEGNGVEDISFVEALKDRNFKPFVLDLHRRDWLRVGRAFFTRKYWAGEATTEEGYNWYLDRVAELVDHALEQTNHHQVDIIAHSAGGWLARAFIGDSTWRCSREERQARAKPRTKPREDGWEEEEEHEEEEDGYFLCAPGPHPKVRCLVTLGSPHLPPAKGKHRDMTGGALHWVNTLWPGAKYADQGFKYICVAGRTVKGNSSAPPDSLSRYAHNTYSMVSGDGTLEGDCVVPLDSATLPGAHNIVLEGVVHSVANLEKAQGRPWYGSEKVVDHWLGPLASMELP
eukprot:jgi/Botrbrau1/7206/Bobra.0300s0032.1